MAYPFFSLGKSKRVAPIDFAAGNVTIRVEAVPDHGMATIWDADILIWAASQIVEARDTGLRTSRLMAATPYEILTYVGRGTSLRDYAATADAMAVCFSKVSPMSRGFLLWYACVMIHKPHVNAASGLNASNVGVKHWRC